MRAAAGMAYLTRLDPHSSYAAGVLPGLVVTGIGLGLIFAPTQNAAASGVRHHDAGVASAMLNTAQQIGGSIGTALLSSFAASAASNYLVGKVPDAQTEALAAIHSYHIVFWSSTCFFLACAVVAAITFRSGPLDVDPDAAPVIGH
jgi:MFS family permease